MLKESPCQFCKSRYLGCHSDCVDYKAFKEERDNTRELIQKIKAEEDIVNEYKLNCTHKLLKRRNNKGEW